MNLVRRGRYGLYVLVIGLLVSSCGDRKSLADLEETDRDPDFDFTADLIAFESTRDGNPDIFLMTTDGSTVINATQNTATDGDPAWSPDGSRLAFASARAGNAEIYVMNVDGSGLVRLTDNPAADRFPSWSPDGSTIAFASDRDGLFEIYLMDADGSNQRRLTTHQTTDLVEPAWLADGSKIVFSSAYPFEDPEEGDIWSMNPDGTGLVNLTNDPSTLDLAPHVTSSPGIPGKISFASDRADGNMSIWTMNSDGSNLFRVTNDPAVDFDPSFSGDGSTLVFDRDQDDNLDIYIIEENATNLNRLTDHQADEWNPVWRP